MSVASALSVFRTSVGQCDSLIANAHGLHPVTQAFFLPQMDRAQITVAAFLNMYIAWETFLEAIVAELLAGAATIGGAAPTKYASPPTPAAARQMVIGINRFFDYGNHQLFSKMVSIYFHAGAPFQPHINGIQSALDDLRTMRHASAHVTSTTQAGLESLALRLLAVPSPGITVYELLTSQDPKAGGQSTIFQTHRDLLLTTAELVANG